MDVVDVEHEGLRGAGVTQFLIIVGYRAEVVREAARLVGAVLPGVERVVLGGKSMGGRIASQAVAQGTPAELMA